MHALRSGTRAVTAQLHHTFPEALPVAATGGMHNMSKSLVRALLLVGGLLAAGAARADFATVLQAAPISASTAVAFHDSNVTVGTTTPDGVYNFLDSYTFSLDGSFQVSTIAAAIDFRDPSGNSVLFGITNLQVNLVEISPSSSVLVSWATVTTPATGLEQTVALIPPSALGAGNYELDVRGNVTAPGSYSGSLLAQPLAPVPLPTTPALFACSILAIGFASARLRRA
jgi:hypothetical protein